MTTQELLKPKTMPISDKPQSKLIDVFCLVALLTLVALTFGRTLESFFIADDFGEVSYVHKIFNGEPNLFWSNFTGNYMQIPSMAVWRPWLLATLVFDYAIWKANAFGYYLTNILYYAGNSILLYALLRKLTRSFAIWRSQAISFFTAALFTVSPLHCESVTWVVGRVDIACCFYYLLSFYLLLNNGKRRKLTTAVATVSFWLALWTKEMAIGLPVMVTAASFLLADSQLKPVAKLKQSILKASPLWLSTLIYFPLRYAFLGTLTGGYTGSIGASQFAGLIKRWLDPDTLHRIAYPLNYTLFQDHSIYGPILFAVYLIAGAIAVTRLFNRELSFKWLAFLLLWTATCAAPIYQLWGLGYDLEGSRFYYFLTLPLSFAFPLLLFLPSASASGSTRKWPIALSSISLALLVFAFGKIAYATNMTWVHAGKEAKAVFNESKTLAQSTNDQFIVLALPKRNSAAHIILNGETFRLMLKPPFTTSNIGNRFNTFEPILFGPAEFINTSRFKDTLSTAKPLVWDRTNKHFKQLQLNASSSAKPLPLPTSQTAQSNYNFSDLNINPLAYDFLAFDIQTNNPQEIKATWNTNSPLKGEASITTVSGQQTFYIPLSRYWRWFTETKVGDVNLTLPEAQNIANVRLLPASTVAPQLKLLGQTDNTGVHNCNSADKLDFVLTRPRQFNQNQITIQIGKADFFFENFPPQEQSTVVGKSLPLSTHENSFALEKSNFDKPGFYQIRAVMESKDGLVASDAITIQRLP